MVDDRLELLAPGYSARSERANIRRFLELHYEFDPQARLDDLLDVYAFLAYHQEQPYSEIDRLTAQDALGLMRATNRLLERVYRANGGEEK